MVELPAMAELMHDDVIGEMRRQQRYPIIEIEVALGRAASPPRRLRAYPHIAVGELVVFVEVLESCVDEGACGGGVGSECKTGVTFGEAFRSDSDDTKARTEFVADDAEGEH